MIVLSAVSAQNDSIAVPFQFKNEEAVRVSVAGSFNNWDADVDSMIQEKGLWTLTRHLKPGYYYYKFVVDGVWIHDPSNPDRVNDGGDGFNSILKVGNPPRPIRFRRDASMLLTHIPVPVVEGGTDLVDLYDAAWEMAWRKVSQGTKENGFVESYMDEGFNDLIFQWDTCFMALFGMYGGSDMPAMASLDNFYMKQRADGYIQRVFHESDGTPVAEPTIEEPLVNPPLFSWVEWEYYRFSADSGRFRRVLPILTRHFQWLKTHLEIPGYTGLYYTSELGSGMDNTPRHGVGRGGWIDMSAQQALNAICISRIADTIGETVLSQRFLEEYEIIKTGINEHLWNPETEFYHDLCENGTLSPTKHIGAYWTMIAKVCPPERASALIRHLTDQTEFWRTHLIPTLAADQPEYNPRGNYWRGGVWAPTNYMVVQGLKEYGYRDLAHDIALNHAGMISRIFEEPMISESGIAFEERYGDGYHTIWECYAPDYIQPATRWDDTFYSRQDFVGWSGLGPIAMAIEDIIGLEIIGSENKIGWHIYLSDTQGIRNLRFLNDYVDLICNPEEDVLNVTVNGENSFLLEIIWNGKSQEVRIEPGNNEYTLER